MGAGPRTIVLVGATSGLGRQAAVRLAADGHRLILAGRDPRRVRDLARELPRAHVIGADVATAAGVDELARQVSAATDRIDTLVNNAGVMRPTRTVTAEGHELNLAVHHLAPFSTTSRVLPLLRRGEGRIVNVNSEGHRSPMRGSGEVALDFDDLDSERGYDPFMAYSRSKLANLLFSYELQARHPELTVVAVHPGLVRTRLGRDFPSLQVRLVHAFALSARRGAEPVVRLATGTVSAGRYYNRFAPVPSSPRSRDTAAARRLWAVTEEVRGPFTQVGSR
ncbi:SDR family NAD(P)-dependent oxidoreductase [Streptomyces sp. NPDC051940]|uniref:SDR family NAD(P)-dependent oxidoreductase n=1 Tax=Streptomyces sp. NPDC051940 TaxID=3155675 RepID=UPI00344A9147